MSLTKRAEQPSAKQLRSFAFLVGGGFAFLGVAPRLFAHGEIHQHFLIVAAVLVVTGLVYAPVLSPVYKLWMTLGKVLGAVNSKIILGIVYYLLFTPIALIRRWTGRDNLHLKFEKHLSTYRIERKGREASHMQRHF